MSLIVVCGLGRCGSSLMMQMLDAGGITCVGRPPMYEDHRACEGRCSDEWLDSLGDSAVKILTPVTVAFRRAGKDYIWLDRDTKQQAYSVAKARGVFLHESPRQQKEYRANITKVRRRCLKQLKPYNPLMLRFEELLAEPLECAKLVQEHLKRPLDVEAMAQAVRPRSPECAADMSLELNWHLAGSGWEVKR